MRVLALETATPVASCAVVGRAGVLSEAALDVPAQPLEGLLPAVHVMLDRLRLAPEDIGGVAVSRGPGGFTGLRIGIATASAWARAATVPLVGVDTLEALALAAGVPGWVFAVLDAHRGEVAAGLYRVAAHVPAERVLGPIVAPPADVAGEAARLAVGGQVVVVVGNGLDRHRDALLAGLDGRGRDAGRDVHPSAGVVGILGRALLAAGARDDPDALRPVYGRRPAIREWQETPNRSGKG